MKKTDLSTVTTENLNSQKQLKAIVLGATVVVLLFILGVNLYGLFNKLDQTPFIIGIFLIVIIAAIVPFEILSIKKINKELDKRMNLK